MSKGGYDNGKGRMRSKKDSGCYVATAVYGSYDCPQVWILRRYRDNKLSKSLLGRLFIRIYYAVSPFFVRHFGSETWFRKFGHFILDRFVESLQNSGYESTPYKDDGV